MATDSAILTVAREVYAALQAVKDQEQVVNRIAVEQTNEIRKLEELKVRQRDAERRLQSYAQQKPAEQPIVAHTTAEQEEIKRLMEIPTIPLGTSPMAPVKAEYVHKKRDKATT